MLESSPMVEHKESSGHYRTALQDFRRENPTKFANYRLYPDMTERTLQLARELPSRPELDKNSLMLHGVTDTQGKPLDVLSTPRVFGLIVPERPDIHNLPREGTAFMVHAVGSKGRALIPTVAQNDVIAQRIAGRELRMQGWHKDTIQALAQAVPSLYLITQIQRRIDNDQYVMLDVLKFAGLRLYALARENEVRKSKGLPSIR